MERIVRVFHDFEAAERAEEDDYASLTPQERLEILLELIAQYRESFGDVAARFERGYRVVDLSRS